MHQYLLVHGYWSYVDKANDAMPEAWEKATSKVMYCFTSSVNNQLFSHIRDTKTPKEAWMNLKKVFVANTTA